MMTFAMGMNIRQPIAGFAVLGVLFYDKMHLISGGKLVFEQVLPSAINEFVPAG